MWFVNRIKLHILKLICSRNKYVYKEKYRKKTRFSLSHTAELNLVGCSVCHYGLIASAEVIFWPFKRETYIGKINQCVRGISFSFCSGVTNLPIDFGKKSIAAIIYWLLPYLIITACLSLNCYIIRYLTAKRCEPIAGN